jgi:dienelactone hydrolase
MCFVARHTVFLCVSACLLLTAVPSAQSDARVLARRGWFGVALAARDAGVVVTAVVPGSSAASNGIEPGDVIRAIDDQPMRAPADVVSAIAHHAAGSTAVIDLSRAGVQVRRLVNIKALPVETLAQVSFEYGFVSLSDGTRLRTIVSTPNRPGGRFPAVMYLQGGGCGSIDNPTAPDVGPNELIHRIAAEGYATMRVEKSGVGDSEGPPCDAIGYGQELEGYRVALTALRRHSQVDADRVFLLGISLGGVFAPTLAARTPVRGIVVYGTLATAPSPYPGRSARFFTEFADVDVPAAWSAVDAPALALHGQFDENTEMNGHVRIAELVNAKHPGTAAARELTGLDHCWTEHSTMDESRGHCGAGRQVSTLTDAVLAFLRSHT